MPKYRERPFSERIRTDSKTGELVEELPLRERFPDYVKAFGLGVAATGAFGIVLWLITSLRLEHALGYTWIFAGVTLLLVGGARGGGYTNLSLGAAEALVGGRNRTDDNYEEDADLRHGKSMKRRIRWTGYAGVCVRPQPDRLLVDHRRIPPHRARAALYVLTRAPSRLRPRRPPRTRSTPILPGPPTLRRCRGRPGSRPSP